MGAVVSEDGARREALDPTTECRLLAATWRGRVERFAGEVVVSAKDRTTALALAEAHGDRRNDRLWWRELKQNPRAEDRLVLLHAPPERIELPRRFLAQEEGVLYWIDLDAGYSTGLFLDQAANRRYVRRLGAKRVLNLFAYTASFSLVAALAGAETVSVDVSRRALQWGQENFVANGIPPTSGHRFLVDDARDVVRRLGKRGEKFDLILLDPPTFGRNKQGKVWQLERHLSELLMGLVPLQEGGGKLLLSCNYGAWERDDLAEILHGAVGDAYEPVPVEASAPAVMGETGANWVWTQRRVAVG